MPRLGLWCCLAREWALGRPCESLGFVAALRGNGLWAVLQGNGIWGCLCEGLGFTAAMRGPGLWKCLARSLTLRMHCKGLNLRAALWGLGFWGCLAGAWALGLPALRGPGALGLLCTCPGFRTVSSMKDRVEQSGTAAVLSGLKSRVKRGLKKINVFLLDLRQGSIYFYVCVVALLVHRNGIKQPQRENFPSYFRNHLYFGKSRNFYISPWILHLNCVQQHCLKVYGDLKLVYN